MSGVVSAKKPVPKGSGANSHQQTALDDDLIAVVERQLDRAMKASGFSRSIRRQLEQHVSRAAKLAAEDAAVYSIRDAAQRGDVEAVITISRTWPAVRNYRLARQLVLSADHVGGVRRQELVAVSAAISADAVARTGVEISPRFAAGTGFVVDHGFGVQLVTGEVGPDFYALQGVVIGETARAGLLCTVGMGTILGALHIADGEPVHRHPVLGNAVSIGGGARVLGPVEVGNCVTIGPGADVRADVGRNSTIGADSLVRAAVGADVVIGPRCLINAAVADGVHVAAGVEVSEPLGTSNATEASTPPPTKGKAS